MKPVVSIAVAIYNVGDYLEKCLESIRTQTYQSLDVILVDDGSTDCCAEICDRFASKDKRFRAIHKINEGLVKARKVGIKSATGKYMYIMDGDDWLDPEWISELVSVLNDSEVDVAIGRYSLSYSNEEKEVRHGIAPGVYDTEKLRLMKPGMLFNIDDFAFGIVNPSFWSKLFIREKILPFVDSTPEKLTMGEDFAFVMPYLMHTEKISFVDTESVYHYRQSDNSMVRKYNPRLKENISNLISYLSDLKIWNENEREQLQYYYLKLITYVYFNQLKETASYKEKRQAVSEIYHLPQYDKVVGAVNKKRLPFKMRILTICLGHKWTSLLALVKR